MIHNEADEELTSKAFFLYIKLLKLMSNERNDKNTLMDKTGLSEYHFKKAKAELLDKGYLETKQLYGNVYAFYIGKESVQQYKQQFKQSYNRREKHQLKMIEDAL